MKTFLLFTLLTAYISALPTHRKIHFQERIVGGNDIAIEEVPYQVSLQYLGRHFCGGSIISSTQIVTAAHCVAGYSEEVLSIRAGTTTRDISGHVIPVSRVLVHPNFDRRTADYDIAVLELEFALTFEKSVQPIVLPSAEQTWSVGTEVLVTGWGTVSEHRSAPASNLQGVTVNILEKKICMGGYGAHSISSRMLCAGVTGGGKDACQEDSGGPMAVNGVLGGVVSFGLGCGRAKFFGVYANVPILRNFIESVTGL